MQYKDIKLENTGVMFKMYANLEFLNSFANCLLITDDSCREIYNDKELVNLATTGCHKNINVIYIRNNLHQQSNRSCTRDLNTTYLILFKSARNFQQNKVLGKHLNLVQFLKQCYQLPTKKPFGHLLIKLDSKIWTVYDTVQILLRQVLHCSIFHLIKQKQHF